MGNARWKGVRLKDLLTRAGVKGETIEIAFNGEDGPPLPTTPDFVKSIPSWKAMDENTLVAYEMNGEPLPHWNGFPARLIVPGWVATYWMKQVSSIRALTQPLKDFWMASAYRIPNDKFPLVERFASQEAQSTTPITEMVVNSLVTNPIENQTVSVGRNLDVSGIAWDGGYGISRVEVSLDGARSWHAAELGTDLGRFSFRPWRFSSTPDARGPLTVIARASNALGATQVDKLIFNKAGYHNNVLHKVSIEVT